MNRTCLREPFNDANDVIIITTRRFRLSKRLHSLPSSIRRIIQLVTPPARKPGPSRRAANSVMPNRPTEPDVPERAYGRLNTQIDRLEDAMNHFYNVINKLRERVSTLDERVSTLEKKLERLSH